MARSHYVITGRNVALMAANAAWLDVTPDVFDVETGLTGAAPQ
ncbi:MAG TPA: hypothetical protein VFP66_09895 [Candidatus Limnocylindrales bacterium]|nr:hypothetical protein [Candidatus Limnocylindrales bacterium]